MREAVVVFLGGGIGSLLRFGADRLIASTTFPISTFLVNIVGCFLAGLVFGFGLESKEDPIFFRLIMTGILGGFTTFSAFGYQSIQLFQKSESTMAFLYIFGTVVICLVSSFGGSFFGSFLTKNLF